MKLIKPLIKKGSVIREISVKDKATDDYNDWLQKSVGTTVWSSCVSWYNLQGGKNVGMYSMLL
jgi:predicted ATPase